MLGSSKLERPLVTVIMVNYNSSKIKDVVLESIKTMLNLDYRPLEIIMVDNGSTDGSFERIKAIIETTIPKDVKVKFLKLSKNYGFAIANIIAFSKRDEKSKYVALVNNDLSLEPDSLGKLIEFLERNKEVAGVQGKILTWDGKRIDSAGCHFTQYGNTYEIGQTLPQRSCNSPYHVGYVDGAYSVYRIEAILRCGGLFLPYFFMYGDDYELGIRLWRGGHKLMYIPITAGRHFRSASANVVRSSLLKYSAFRSEFSVILMYDNLWLLHVLFRIPMILIFSLLKPSKDIMRGFIDGVRTGLKLRTLTRSFRHSQIREPRLKINIIHWYAHLFRLFLFYGTKASRISYLLISRYLGTQPTKKKINFKQLAHEH